MINISVALCTYNGEDYLRQQLISILNQTMAVDEIVICDDCSSDNTVLIINEFKEKYPKLIRFYQNDTNLGYRRNFDNCYRLCKGEYIFSCDQDDIWNDNKVEKIFNTFKENTMLVFTNASIIDKNGNDVNKTLWGILELDYNSISNNEVFKETIRKRFVVTGATMAFRKSMYDKIEICSYTYEHDALIARVAPIFGEVIAINEKLIKYRRHGKNATIIEEVYEEIPKKRTIIDKLKLNYSKIISNGRYSRFAYPCELLEPVYHISKNYDNDYSRSYNEPFLYFDSLYKMSKMNRLKSICCLTKFICNKDNRDAYKKYKGKETFPIIKDYVYFLFARGYQ